VGPTVRLATRGSPLALWQAERVGSILSDRAGRAGQSLKVELVVMSTRGDIDARAPLSSIGGQGVFVKEIQQAVLDGRADCAVHSAKDLPSFTPDGLVIACVPERADPRDALVGMSFDELRPGATVATGSPRRRAQLAWLRPDLTFRELRGSISTRVDKSVEIGAGVVAMAAAVRLGITDRVAYVFEPTVMLPQVAQGAIAVECRADDGELRELLGAAEDRIARLAVDAERAFLAQLGGGCNVPVAAFAQVTKNVISLEGMIASHDGRIVLRRTASGTNPVEVGTRLAQELIREAGGKMLDI
jgi:hydroxymethylbilane synthase